LASTWHCVWCLLTAACATAQSLFSPVAGVLGDRFHRGFLIAVGTLLWSAFSFLFGFTKKFSPVPPGGPPPPPPPPPSVLGRSSYVLGRSHCRLTACAHRPTLPKAKCSCAGCGVDGADGLWCRSDGASVQLHPCRHVSREQSRDCFWTDVLYKRPRCADYWLFSLPLSPVGSTCLIYVRFSILADLLYAV
jgi:hypothetical protein